MSELAIDSDGYPILLESGPGVDVQSRSGNPSHVPAGQPGGGRFGTRGKNGKKPNVADVVSQRGTAGVTAEELARRTDAVREAAREFESFGTQDISDWLRGKVNRPFTQADVDAFLADVRAQQLSDLVDALDDAQRGSGRKRRRVRVVMPKGYRRLTLNRLEDSELKMVATRLRARGWSDAQVGSLSGHLPQERQGTLSRLGEPRTDFPILSPGYANPAPPQPPPDRVRVVHRDENGLIASIEERNAGVD